MTDDFLRFRITRAVDTRLSGVADDPFLAQRTAAHAKGDTPMKKKFAAFPALVTAVILLTAAVAVAVDAVDWHVLDWLTPAQDNPYEASFPQTTGDTSHAVADVRIHEAVSDGYGVYLSVVCTPREENVLLLNASVHPRDDVAILGLTPDYPRQTIASWAENHGYTMYDIRLYTAAAYPDLLYNTGFDSMLGSMKRMEDGSVVIMMGGGTVPLAIDYELNYIIVPYQKTSSGLWQVDEWAAVDQQQAIAFSVDVPNEPVSEVIAEYAVSADTPTEHINLLSCRLLRTPLAAYIEYVYTLRDDSVTPADRWLNDRFNAQHAQLTNWDVRMEIHAAEAHPDGSTQYCYMETILLPDELPDEMRLDAALFMPGSAGDAEENVTLIRISK